LNQAVIPSEASNEKPKMMIFVFLVQLFRPKEEFRVCGYMVPEFSEMRLKQGHKYHGSINIFVPPIPRPETNANQAVPVAPTGHRLTHSPTTPPGANNEKTNSSSRVPVAARKGLASCFRCISSDSN
jgi:hypothetical protein